MRDEQKKKRGKRRAVAKPSAPASICLPLSLSYDNLQLTQFTVRACAIYGQVFGARLANASPLHPIGQISHQWQRRLRQPLALPHVATDTGTGFLIDTTAAH